MYKLENYMAQVAGFLFVCQKIAFCSFVGTRLCLYFQSYQLILKTQHKIGKGSCGQSHKWLMSPLFFYFQNSTSIDSRAHMCVSFMESFVQVPIIIFSFTLVGLSTKMYVIRLDKGKEYLIQKICLKILSSFLSNKKYYMIFYI